MTRLTRAKQLTRTATVGLCIAIVALIVIRVGLNILASVTVEKRQAVAQAKPDVAFKAIPTPALSPSSVNTSQASVRLDLVNGALPQASASAKVFKVAKPALSLSAQDRARARATKLGFTGTPAQPTPDTFIWKDGDRTLTVSLTDQTFKLTTNVAQVNLTNRLTFGQFEPLASRTTQFLQSQFTFPDLQYSKLTTNFGLLAGDIFQPQNPDVVIPSSYYQASLLRQNLNGLPIYSARGKMGPINLVAIPAKKDAKVNNTLYLDQILQLDSSYLAIDQTESGTYPIIPAQTAYNQLQAHLSQYVVSVVPNSSTLPTTFSGGRVQFATLVYLEPDAKNPTYIQPVWMFEGRANTNAGEAKWIAYVPAIDAAKTQTLLAP